MSRETEKDFAINKLCFIKISYSMLNFERKKTLLLLVFSVLLVGLSLFFIIGDVGFNTTFEQEQHDRDSVQGAKSFLYSVDYFYVEDERPRIFLNGDILIMYENGNVGKVVRPKGRAYSDSGQELIYAASEGAWDKKNYLVELFGDVKMQTADSWVEADKSKYDLKSEVLNYLGNVKTKTISKETGDTIFVDSQKATSWTQLKKSSFQGEVKGHILRKRIYEESVRFFSDILNIDLNTEIIDLLGGVTLKKQNITAEALKGEIHLKDYNKKLKYYALSDDVKLQQDLVLSDNKKITRKAFAERLEGIVSEDKIILTGNPKVFQERDVVKGNKIILRGENETVEVDDAITSVIVK